MTPPRRRRMLRGIARIGPMDLNDPSVIARRLVELRTEHRDLDLLIGRLTADQAIDQLTLTRMKKRKLRLKDEIAWLQSRLIPDLDA
jgi:hypothetical protein